jgi:catecholate siderophore receptor
MRKLGKAKKRSKTALTVVVGAGALAASLVPASAQTSYPAPGQPSVSAGSATTPTPPGQKRPIVLAAQPLIAALTQFSQQTGIRVIYDPGELRDLTARAISGDFTPEEALRALLAGTDVSYRFVDAANVRLTRTLRTIGSVTTTSAGNSVSSKYTAPLLQTPQSVVVIPHDVLVQRNATSFGDVMKNVSGISLTAGEGGAQGDAMTIRGFSSSGDIYLDGVRDFGEYYRDPFDLESVEISEGPSSTIVGPGSAGGFINQITKKPQLQPLADVTATGETNNGERLTFDFNQPLSASAAFRLDGMQTAANVAGRNVTDIRRWGAAPAIEFGIGTPTRVLLAFEHLTEHDIPDYGIPYLWGGPAPVSLSTYYGFSDDEFFENTDIATATVEHDVSSTLSLRNVTRSAAYERTFRAATAAFATPPPVGTPLANINVTRQEHAENGNDHFFDNQTDLIGQASTGPFQHSFDLGIEIGTESAHDVRPTYNGLPGTTLVNPVTQPITFTSITPGSDAHINASTSGLYALDSIRFGKRWEINGGIRWDIFSAHDIEAVSQTNAAQSMTALTGHAGLVYDVAQNGTVYLSYATSFDPAVDSLVLTQAGSLVPPEFDESYELGSKWQFNGGKFSLRGALFKENAQNVALAEDSYTSTAALVGNEAVQGVDLRAEGHITKNWELTAGYTLVNGTILTANQPGAAGNPLVNVPNNSATVWSTYEFGRGWAAGIGTNGLSARFARPSPSSSTQGLIPEIPGYWRLDAMVKAPISSALAMQLNLYNLTNKQYYDAVYTDHVIPGAAFSADLSILARFR